MIVGLVVVMAATAWLAGGSEAVLTAGAVVARSVPWVAVAAGALLLIRAAVPAGLRAGPTLLLAVGIAALVIESGRLRAPLLRDTIPVVILISGVIMASIPPSTQSRQPNAVRRLRSFVWPVEWRPEGVVPTKAILLSVLGQITVDFGVARFPMGDDDRVTVDVTIFGGRIDIVVPHDWHVRAGRVELSRHITFLGAVSDPMPPDEDDEVQRMMVLNVQGRGGVLSVAQMPAPEPAPRRRRFWRRRGGS